MRERLSETLDFLVKGSLHGPWQDEGPMDREDKELIGRLFAAATVLIEDAHEIAVAGQSPKSGVKATVGAACALREAAQDAAILAQAALIIARRAGPRDRH